MRSAGILLHPTSLPGPYGIGDLGPIAFRWVDTLAAMKQTWWQILPLGPTGYGDSPYQCFSAFAGNTLLISPEKLIEDQLLPKDFAALAGANPDRVDFESVTPFKRIMIRTAWDHFRSGSSAVTKNEFEEWCHCEKAWLDDYALFRATRDALGGAPLCDWPQELLNREPVALAAMEREVAGEISRVKFGQFLFDRQWKALRDYAKTKKVQFLGDVPIFVASDSADVWANADQFLLSDDRRPSVVAGVPPDYFCEDGQFWGNPIYDWSAMAEDGYSWWIARVKRALAQVDLVRFDHFRGFVQAWHIPADEKTARNGKWVDGSGKALFEAIAKAIGGLPLVAEDLGYITPDVLALRESLKLPGMRVLQFMLGDPKNTYQPHNYEPHTVCYTGTHDNDTSAGWYWGLNENDRTSLTEYVGHEFKNPARELIRLAWSSVAEMAITPLQDVFCLGSAARMNVPGQPGGNWRWRFRTEHVTPQIIEWMAGITQRYARY